MREMKDSGIEWIGKIPKEWGIVKFKYLHNGLNTGEAIDKEYWESDAGLNAFYTAGLTPIRTGYSNFPTWKETGENDLLLARNGTPYVYLPVSKAYYTDHIIRAAMSSLVNRRFIRYCLQQSIASIAVDSVSIPTWSATLWNNQILTWPSVIEQERIAAFLDAECAEIDAVLEKTRASIEEYKKLKQAVITQAVTKGIRGDRPMKDSGIEWIGDIPESWEVSSVRYIGQLQNGISKGGEFFGKGFPFVSYGDVYKNYELPHSVSGLIDTTEDERATYSVEYGDIFFTRTSETIEEVGFSCVCKRSIPNATFAGFIIRLRPFCADEKILTDYAKYYFRGEHIRAYLVKEMNLVTRASLGQTLLKGMSVIVPPKSAQKEIAEYLDDKCADIDALIAKKQQYLTEIENYKKSLIYEYVTGKKEVV